MTAARATAARLLAPVIQGQAAFNPYRASDDQAALINELCLGTLRFYPQLQCYLSQLLNKPLKARDSDITALILIGLYQLLYMRTPDHAAINETVSASLVLKKRWARGLVNGVLRRFTREQTELAARCQNLPAFISAHPDWLSAKIEFHWPEHAAQIFEAGNHRPPFSIRVNCLHQSRDAYLARLRELNIGASPTPISSSGIRLDTAVPVELLPGFNEGDVSIQDESAQLCAALLQLREGQRVLDACAAPGGKTGHLLEICPTIRLTALDIEPKRVKKIEENLCRLNLTAQIRAADARSPKDWWDGKPFDRILLDAPCSGTGVIRRHPDIKLTRRETDIAGFNQQQTDILNACWGLLASGGLLLYATCSILPQENENIIQRFVNSRDDVEPVAISGFGVTRQFGVQMLPDRNGADGFYYSLLRKTHS